MAEAAFDLNAYLLRIGGEVGRTPSPETLRSLHERHLGAIPFENLDVRLGRPVGLDLASLQDKLVARRRGGYCFEHNSLFAAVLRELGFEVDTLEARVRPPGAAAPLPRTHMVLRVRTGDRGWLADVGFGGDGTLWPVPLDGEAIDQPGGPYRVADEGTGVRVLQRWDGVQWLDLYAFTLWPALAVDYLVAHHFTSTHPGSPFVNTLTVQRATKEARHVLRGRVYTRRGDGDEVCSGLSDSRVHALLGELFGLAVSPEEVAEALLGL